MGVIKPQREEGGREMSSQRRNKGILELEGASSLPLRTQLQSHSTVGEGKKKKKKKSNYKNELFLDKMSTL